MTSEIYCGELSEEAREEISFLYKMGITADELDYLIRLKLGKKN